MTKIFKLVRPRSIDIPAYEDFEYLIRWIGDSGEDYFFMFLDAEIRRSIEADVINDLDTNIQSLISSNTSRITLFATDLSLNDMLIISELMSNKYVTRLKKDGTIERFATASNSFTYRLRDNRYEIEFNLIPQSKKVWR